MARWCVRATFDAGDRHSCPQCQAPYTIIEPPHSRLVAVGDSLNTALDAASPVAAVTAGVLCFWAGLGVYGAVTFAHVCGQEGRHIIRQMHPVKLFLLMPMVPISLVILRMRHAINLRLRTSDGRLQLSVAARQTDDAPREAETTRGTGHVARGRGGVEGHPGEAAEEEEAHLVDVQREAAEEGDEDLQLPEIISQMKTSRIVLGGLMLPYMSMAIGKVFLAPWHLHPFDRAVYGGAHPCGGCLANAAARPLAFRLPLRLPLR